MLFPRRIPETRWQKLRIALWPRHSFGRSLRYVAKRVLRLRATPHAIAIGVAAGVFAAFNPFLGLHTVMAMAIAWVLSGNLIAAALSTWFGNPLTYPFIWAGTWEIGALVLGHPPHQAPAGHESFAFSLARVGELWDPLLKPMLIGSLPAGLVAAGIAYAVTRKAAAAFISEREERLAARQPTGEGA